jgi:hypothetical protein
MCAQAQSAFKKELAAVERQKESEVAMHNPMAAFHNIPIKAVRSFKNTWQQVDNETWYEIPEGYRARFTEDGVLYLVTYNKKGKWMHTMRQYDETKLQRDARAQVKSVYYDYNIVLIEEIEYFRKPLTYIIHMEDKVSFKNIRLSEREMEVISEIDKL